MTLRSRWCASILLLLAISAFAQAQDDLRLLPPIEDVGPEVDGFLPGAGPNVSVDAPADVPAPQEEAVGSATDVPLDTEEVVANDWFYPRIFYNSEYWTGNVEFGLSGSTGNTETFTYRLGSDLKHKTPCNEFIVTANYVQGTADGQENVNNGMLTIRDDWDFCDSPWLLFAKHTMEYDEFKAFDLRLTGNAGLGYYWVKSDPLTLKGRFGAGTSKEIHSPNENWIPEAVFAFDYEHQITSRQKIEIHSEYLPQWDEFENFRMESKGSWLITLDEAKKLSLKISVIDRYDSTPEGKRPNDLDYAMLLMWKL